MHCINLLCHEVLHKTSIFIRTVTRIVGCETLWWVGQRWVKGVSACTTRYVHSDLRRKGKVTKVGLQRENTARHSLPQALHGHLVRFVSHTGRY